MPSKFISGVNDLATLFPDVAAEADGWDPSTLLPGSNKKMSWKCKEGHTWETSPDQRTRQGSGCHYCSNRKVWKGFNDLQSKFPEIAKEADGWDPSTVLAGTHKKMSWKCEKGHTWEASPGKRVDRKQGCPYCRNVRVWSGFNDLKTRFPEVAKEAHGWDPSTVMPGTQKKMTWKCSIGHIWETTPDQRTQQGSGCLYCSNQRVLVGFNDLKTRFPEVAKEANGWDPATVLPGNQKKRSWKCKEGHTWESTPDQRTTKGTGCHYCTNRKVWVGFNDLQSKCPEIAKEADGWDPKTLVWTTHKKVAWKCEKGHTWNAEVAHRTSTSKSGCPYCSNTKVWVGFNDLQTLFPEIAKEADGWDPSTVMPGNSSKRLPWKCEKGHTWKTTPSHRTGVDPTGCPGCAESGFNPERPAWFYLLERPGEQQLGITHNFRIRMKTHRPRGWKVIQKTGPHPGRDVQATEKALKDWLKAEVGVLSGTQENWSTSNLEVKSLAELKEKSGIETSIF